MENKSIFFEHVTTDWAFIQVTFSCNLLIKTCNPVILMLILLVTVIIFIS